MSVFGPLLLILELKNFFLAPLWLYLLIKTEGWSQRSHKNVNFRKYSLKGAEVFIFEPFRHTKFPLDPPQKPISVHLW